jgi:hypothetical protein
LEPTTPSSEPLVLAVRDLCEWAFRGEGSALSKKEAASAWIPGRAKQGRLVHQTLQAEAMQEEGCRCEVPLVYKGQIGGQDIRMSGRADIIRGSGRIEEVKTVLSTDANFRRFEVKAFPAHEMQALLYAWMAGCGETVSADLRLVNLGSGNERILPVSKPAARIVEFIETQVVLLLAERSHQNALTKARKTKARTLRFPFPD